MRPPPTKMDTNKDMLIGILLMLWAVKPSHKMMVGRAGIEPTTRSSSGYRYYQTELPTHMEANPGFEPRPQGFAGPRLCHLTSSPLVRSPGLEPGIFGL